jgi:hypothetical protein
MVMIPRYLILTQWPKTSVRVLENRQKIISSNERIGNHRASVRHMKAQHRLNTR